MCSNHSSTSRRFLPFQLQNQREIPTPYTVYQPKGVSHSRYPSSHRTNCQTLRHRIRTLTEGNKTRNLVVATRSFKPRLLLASYDCCCCCCDRAENPTDYDWPYWSNGPGEITSSFFRSLLRVLTPPHGSAVPFNTTSAAGGDVLDDGYKQALLMGSPPPVCLHCSTTGRVLVWLYCKKGAFLFHWWSSIVEAWKLQACYPTRDTSMLNTI